MLSRVPFNHISDYFGFPKLFNTSYHLCIKRFTFRHIFISYSTTSQTDRSTTIAKKNPPDNAPKLSSKPASISISPTNSTASATKTSQNKAPKHTKFSSVSDSINPSQSESKTNWNSSLDEKPTKPFHRQQHFSQNQDKNATQHLQTFPADKHISLAQNGQREKSNVSQTQAKRAPTSQHKNSKQSSPASTSQNSRYSTVKKPERTTDKAHHSSSLRAFDAMYEERRSQAARTIFVRVSSESELDFLQNRCSRFGAIQLFFSALPQVSHTIVQFRDLTRLQFSCLNWSRVS